MSQKEEREFDRKRLAELILAVEPAKNENIAREAVDIASKWLIKAENQAAQIKNLENRAQRMKGKWVKVPEFCGDDVSGFIDNHFSCSECKKEAEINLWGMYILSDFCPNCGADMRGTE